MMSPTVMRGSREANGSWKIICIFRRTRRSRAPRILVISSPSKMILPPVTGRRAVISRASVDFPQPDSPTNPSASPRRISRSTPSTARTARPPNPAIGKCLYTPCTRRMTGSSLTAVPVAVGAVCITKSAGGAVGLAAAAHPIARLQVPRRRDRDRARLGRGDVRIADIPHQYPAPRHLVRADLRQLWLFHLAPVGDERTPRVELAPRRRVGEIGREPLDADEPVLAGLVDAG